MVRRSCRTCLVVVSYKVIFPVASVRAFAAVTGVAAPVVNHVIDDGDRTTLGGDIVMVDTGVAAVVVGKEVVVVCGVVSAPDAAVAVISLAMDRYAETLGNDVPGEGEVLHSVEGGTFVGAPGDGAVVDNNAGVAVVGMVHDLDGIVLGLLLIPHAAADETHDDVACTDAEGVVLEADAVSGSALACNGEVSLGDVELLLKGDGAGYVEDDGKGP